MPTHKPSMMPEENEHTVLAREAIKAGGELYCPNCRKYYTPTMNCRRAARFEGDQTNIEQWDSGLCSDACWSAYVMNGDDSDTIIF